MKRNIGATANLSDLKNSPLQVIKSAGNEAIAIMEHNKPAAYLITPAAYEKMTQIIDDYYLSCEVKEALNKNEMPVKVNLNDL